MKRLPIFLLLCVMAACIKDAPQNPEADIETFAVDTSDLTGNTFIDQANGKILLYLTPDAYDRGVAPVLTLSHGATVSPASGDSIHFDAPVTYTVTSQSGQTHKSYKVIVVTVGSWDFNFERWGIQSPDGYQYPQAEEGEDESVLLWSSGNPGVALSGVPKEPGGYPTRMAADGYLGTHAAELNTLNGTALSALVGIHLFSGSLFLGNFNSLQAFVQPLKATEFGQPYIGLPGHFTGYYKYTPGPTFQDEKGKAVAGATDSCSIYAVFFNGPDRLDGTNVLTSDKIIAIARLPQGAASADFKRFDLPFRYDTTRTISNNTMVSIVCASSYQGDLYRGAIGSRLVVDSLRILPQ